MQAAVKGNIYELLRCKLNTLKKSFSYNEKYLFYGLFSKKIIKDDY